MRDPELMQTLFHAVNPAYPSPQFGSLVGTPSGRDERLEMVTSRMAERIKADPEVGCVLQFRDISLRDITHRTGASVAKFTITVCTVFRKRRSDDKSFILTDDLPLVQ